MLVRVKHVTNIMLKPYFYCTIRPTKNVILVIKIKRLCIVQPMLLRALWILKQLAHCHTPIWTRLIR